MSGLLMERLKFIKGIDPASGTFDGTVYSDVVNMANFSRLAFVVFLGVGATGTSTLTVQACDNVTPDNRTAVPFEYREITTGDTEGTITAAGVAGFLTTAGSSKLVVVEIRSDALSSTGYGYVQLKGVEGTDSPVIAGVVIVGEAMVASASKVTAIT